VHTPGLDATNNPISKIVEPSIIHGSNILLIGLFVEWVSNSIYSGLFTKTFRSPKRRLDCLWNPAQDIPEQGVRRTTTTLGRPRGNDWLISYLQMPDHHMYIIDSTENTSNIDSFLLLKMIHKLINFHNLIKGKVIFQPKTAALQGLQTRKQT